MPAILSVDCGTTGLKATVIARAGQTLATCTHEYRNKTVTAGGGIAEQDPEDWWFAMQMCVQELLLSPAVDVADLSAISLSGQMQDVIFVAAEGRTLGPAILYCDSRAVKEAEAVEAQFGKERISRETGICVEKLRCRVRAHPDAGLIRLTAAGIAGNWKGSLSILPKLLWCQKYRQGAALRSTIPPCPVPQLTLYRTRILPILHSTDALVRRRPRCERAHSAGIALAPGPEALRTSGGRPVHRLDDRVAARRRARIPRRDDRGRGAGGSGKAPAAAQRGRAGGGGGGRRGCMSGAAGGGGAACVSWLR